MSDIKNTNISKNSLETVTLGAGCFWCVEAVFMNLRGVSSAVSGYSGGKISNPTYREVCSGRTGHAEVLQVTFDPNEISLEQIFDVFWHSHDPTTPNRQGNDIGTQYRSAIYFHTEEQRQVAEKSKKEMDESGEFSDPIVTEITPFDKFYIAEEHHQDYFFNNPEQPYCQFVVGPKVKKFKERYAALIKDKSQQV